MKKTLLCYKLIIFIIILLKTQFISGHLDEQEDTSQISRNNESNILCPHLSKGQYPHPFDDYYYIKCASEKTLVKKCTYGKKFHTSKRKCVSIHKLQSVNSDNNDLYTTLFRCPPNKRAIYLYPYNPRKYVKCDRDKMIVLDCGSLEVFSISQGICLPEEQVSQDDRVALPTTKLIHTNGPDKNNNTIYCPIELFGLYPHPFNNEKYLKCVYGRLYEKSCSSGYVYNIFTKFCERNETDLYKTLPPTGNNKNDKSKIQKKNGSTFLICPTDLDGTFVHPLYCSKYIICSPAGTSIRNCPIGNVYNFHKGACGYKSEMNKQYHVECIQNNENSEDKNTFGVYCKPEGNRNYSHPINVHKFIRCSDGKLLVRWCPKNTFYDIESRKCINDTNEIEE
ncbi:uncharacterized protein LOC124420126 [Lucilia cuprina]|uniref:uncharacterized protein LOC124420126 n=1 Tax=Lucilia cuprina TaxID=7375 RepID=UPI001F06BE30|nr:uncharacterized protein LOC124420126 [Lucilia cuprina]